MKIYTKTGDQGETCLFDGSRTSKDDLRLNLIGEIDGLNAYLGLIYSLFADHEIQENILAIIHDLFELNAHIAGAKNSRILDLVPKIAVLERSIDRMDDKLTPLTNFIYPVGSVSIATTHIARTICRKAERKLVRASVSFSFDKNCLPYLNRLSDWLFTLARYIAYKDGIKEMTIK